VVCRPFSEWCDAASYEVRTCRTVFDFGFVQGAGPRKGRGVVFGLGVAPYYVRGADADTTLCVSHLLEQTSGASNAASDAQMELCFQRAIGEFGLASLLLLHFGLGIQGIDEHSKIGRYRTVCALFA